MTYLREYIKILFLFLVHNTLLNLNLILSALSTSAGSFPFFSDDNFFGFHIIHTLVNGFSRICELTTKIGIEL